MATELQDREVALVIGSELPPVFARYVLHNPQALDTRPPFGIEFNGRQPRPALHERIAQVDAAGRQFGITLAGCAPIARGPILLPQARGILAPLAIDPHFQAGALGAPWSVRSRLRRMAKSPLEFDDFYILHELSDVAFEAASHRQDVRVADLATLLGPPKVDPVARLLADGTERVAKAAAVVVVAGTAIPIAAVTAVAALTAAAAAIPALAVGALLLTAIPAMGVDPVLLGAVSANGTISEGNPAAFYILACWR
jgi:hypothetical protein